MVDLRIVSALSALLFLACDAPPTLDAGPGDAGTDGGADAGPLPQPAADYFGEGPFAVGNVRLELTDAARSRTLPVELWYPAAESARAAAQAGQALSAFEREAPRDAQLAGLLVDAPAGCTRATTRSADAPDAAEGTDLLPLIVFSHCHVCTRFDAGEIAERLASFGAVVAAPAHEGNTLYDELDGVAAAVGEEFLEVRVADVRFVLDRMLAGDEAAVPEGLRGRIDPARVGAMGHSFGAATVGVTAARDDRVAATMAIAAPIGALGGGVNAANLTTPFLFLLAEEDNSIGEAGNFLLRNEHRTLGAPSLLVEVRDAGHWSFSDHGAIIEAFGAGCGAGVRQTVSGEAFDYLEPALARDLAAGVAAAFFGHHLAGDEGGLTPILLGAHSSGAMTVSYRP